MSMSLYIVPKNPLETGEELIFRDYNRALNHLKSIEKQEALKDFIKKWFHPSGELDYLIREYEGL